MVDGDISYLWLEAAGGYIMKQDIASWLNKT